MGRKQVINEFHKLYYKNKPRSARTRWLGYVVGKNPMDYWTFQEIIYETRPTVIIETGSSLGGSALFFASMLDLIGGEGRVLTVDIKSPEITGSGKVQASHPRITYLVGSSISKSIVKSLQELVSDLDRVMVNLDSRHFKNYVLQEMEIYSKFVSVGCYMIVDDTNLGHPVTEHKIRRYLNNGPWEAVEEFLKTHDNFTPDRSREGQLLTFMPRGYLLRTS